MLMNKVRKAYAVIHEPAKVSDNPIKFTAGLTAAVLLIADIENVSRIENVRVQVSELQGIFCQNCEGAWTCSFCEKSVICN
jgi:hypothetical protein